MAAAGRVSPLAEGPACAAEALEAAGVGEPEGSVGRLHPVSNTRFAAKRRGRWPFMVAVRAE